MSKEKWSDEKKQRFIKSYINLPALWNVADPSYAVKSKKDESYRALMDEFKLSLIEVKNKIRIYRTTYGQELKKLENSNVSSSKLLWFSDLHKAFHRGKIKSFTKSPSVKKDRESKLIHIEYEEEEEEEKEDSSDEKKSEVKYEIKKVDKQKQQQSIIIEPYYEFGEEENSSNQFCHIQETRETSPPAKILNIETASPQTSSFTGSGGMQSNELFLKSLQSILDKLPDAKNMRARIKIQEVLYQIAYEVDK